MNHRERPTRNEVQHDLHFTDASLVENFGFASIKDIKHECLHAVWYTFQDSTESVRIMSLLPQAVVSATVEYILPLTQAIHDVLGRPKDDADLSTSLNAIDARFAETQKGFFATRPLVRDFLERNVVRYNKHNLVNSSLTRGGYFALLEAQVIGIWSAFDTLTTELCVAVVNARPDLLKKLGDRQTTLNEFLRASGNHDWSGKLGELVKVFVRFDSFKNTREAYKKLFGDKSINAVLDCPSASIACLVRTQITHDGGIVTSSFKTQAKAKDAHPWKFAEIGKLLPLDGRNVGTLTKSLVQCANDLILAVDNWLHLPPSEPSAK